jgi:hypothetical protein
VPTDSPTTSADFYVSFSGPDGTPAGRVRHLLEQLGFTVVMRDTGTQRSSRERLEHNERLLGSSKNLIAVYTKS